MPRPWAHTSSPSPVNPHEPRALARGGCIDIIFTHPSRARARPAIDRVLLLLRRRRRRANPKSSSTHLKCSSLPRERRRRRARRDASRRSRRCARSSFSSSTRASRRATSSSRVACRTASSSRREFGRDRTRVHASGRATVRIGSDIARTRGARVACTHGGGGYIHPPTGVGVLSYIYLSRGLRCGVRKVGVQWVSSGLMLMGACVWCIRGWARHASFERHSADGARDQGGRARGDDVD